MRMLRVSYVDSADATRWTLCGHLAGPWVEELRLCWRDLRRLSPRAREVIDLSDVTFIDEAGERLLLEMQGAGVEFIAAGVENKDLLANLKGERERVLRRVVEHLAATPMAPSAPEHGDK
jgi:hypothetical protein